jgi:hypothetical protein
MTESVAIDIVHAVADVKGTDPTNVGYVLSDYIDCDALERLVDNQGNSLTVSFELPDHTVTVYSDETTRVEVQARELESQVDAASTGD